MRDTCESLLSSAGGSLLTRTDSLIGLDRALSDQLRPWRASRANHDPGKIALDLAATIALGGDCLADVAARGRSLICSAMSHPTRRCLG